MDHFKHNVLNVQEMVAIFAEQSQEFDDGLAKSGPWSV